MSRVFNGTTDQLNTPANAVYNNLAEFTWAAWINPNTIGPFQTILLKSPNASYSPYLATASGPTLTSFVGTVSGQLSGGAFSNSIEVPAIGIWSHVVMSFKLAGDAKIHLYINGVETTYSDQIAAIGPLTDDSSDGYYFGNDTFGSGFNGRIAELAEWNTQLTPVQIATLAASTTGAAAIAPSNLVGYWHLCGTASPEPDATANGDDAILSSPGPTQGSNSPGFNCSTPSSYSVPDCRNFATFPNSSRTINNTKIYDVQTSSNPAVPGTDSRTAGAPVASGTYPQNSRTPGTFGPDNS